MMHDLPLNLCVVNGYPKESRDALDNSNVSQAHDLYLDFLPRKLPKAHFAVLFAADPSAKLPTGATLTSFDGCIWTGSNLTIYHDKPEVARQIEFCRAVYEAGVPQFGSCWGAQMAAVAAGGQVRKNPNGREWCIARDISLTGEGCRHPMYSGKPGRFDGFIMHLDEIARLPPGGTLLATNDHTTVQSLEVRYPGGGTFWATQYHPEFTLFEMARLLVARKGSLVREGFFGEEKDLLSQVEQMTALSNDPSDLSLRAKLGIGPDLLDDAIRQCEVMNWLRLLVVPTRRA